MFSNIEFLCNFHIFFSVQQARSLSHGFNCLIKTMVNAFFGECYIFNEWILHFSCFTAEQFLTCWSCDWKTVLQILIILKSVLSVAYRHFSVPPEWYQSKLGSSEAFGFVNNTVSWIPVINMKILRCNMPMLEGKLKKLWDSKNIWVLQELIILVNPVEYISSYISSVQMSTGKIFKFWTVT